MSVSCYRRRQGVGNLAGDSTPRPQLITQVRHPIWLPAVRPPGARTFASRYGLESFARASVSSVIPIQAYDLLQDKQEIATKLRYAALTQSLQNRAFPPKSFNEAT